MEKKHQLAMLASIMHIVNGDWGALVYDLTEMDIVLKEDQFVVACANMQLVVSVMMVKGFVVRNPEDLVEDSWKNKQMIKLNSDKDLEEALDEVVFNDGIPDIKFSRVLGLALAADQNFKTFQTAYPYVVQKLLYDNSASTRKILYPFDVQLGSNAQDNTGFEKFKKKYRKDKSDINGANVHNILVTCKSSAYSQNVQEGVFEVANLILHLLPSKDGIVLRRLLMTADATSLTGAIVSKDATFFRQHLSWALADIISHWMIKAVGWNEALGQHDAPSPPVLQKVLSDRRMKVILYKVLHDIRGDPILMLRLCWSSFTIFVTAVALALHRFVVYGLGALFTSVSFVPRRVAVM
ncbi:hypothetical protein COCNU_scaffold017833G000020 [Cocos nucifera]|nr:hypothetical protein [Cocos nucifera]